MSAELAVDPHRPREPQRLPRPNVVALEVNGAPCDVLVRPGATLLSALRDTLGLTATRRGCETGSCGACTVLVEGAAVMSCLTLAEVVDGARVETLEGLAPAPDRLHPLQQAFLDHFATQCGFCTAGMILAAKALIARDPDPSREAVVEAISGNVCRCTGYEAIVTAVLAAAAEMRRSAG
jgi:carbon-monoxide dehydrogenase small subunit